MEEEIKGNLEYSKNVRPPVNAWPSACKALLEAKEINGCKE